MFNKTKVPVIMQMEALECGAASLAMILAHHGKWVPLAQVRSDCGVSRDGSNLKNMVIAAKSYGLVAHGYKCDLEQVKQVALPAIIHWNFNHFVVLTKVKKNSVMINDPARGQVEVLMDEFDKSFTGIALCLEKGEDFVPGGKPSSVIGFAKKKLEGTLVPFLFVVITGILTALLTTVVPVMQRIFYDNIITR